MKLTIGTAAAVVLVAAVPTTAQRRGRPAHPTIVKTESVALDYQGRTRRYLLHVPDSPGGALVLAFHGGGETPENQQQISSFDALSDRSRFIVAYPEGIGKSWADGRGTTNADRDGVDDVGFARAVVMDIAKTQAIDRTRIYATGPSNGGIFVNRLACDAPDLFVAVAPVIGTIASKLAPSCHPPVPVAVVGVQGVADPVVPFKGGEVGGTLRGASAGGAVESSRATQELWRSIDGCDPTPASTPMHAGVQDGTSVTRRVYSGCKADVVWYEIEGGGHRWPPHKTQGVAENLARRTLGVSSQNINASETIWAFFASHPRSRR
ncbi:MAG TPA: PHB depolymerase family esterase [Vicinamibacterales bacterium]|nr:PHB depolymerase family esterase [Vicinamibacterales bacterium]